MASLYKPLAGDEIRLLFLHAVGNSSSSAQIECTLVTVLLSNYGDHNGMDGIYDDAYEALSYAWGTEPATFTIQVNGDSFAIRPNLASALRSFRQSSHTRILWVDFLCINQGDLQERTQQVALMSRIYGYANEVLIWLGPFDLDMALAFEYIDTWTDFTAGQFTSGNETNAWDAVMTREKILASAWFSRVWVVQEFAVANAAVFCCGSMRMRPRKLMRFLQGHFAVDRIRTSVEPWVAEMALLVSNPLDRSWDGVQGGDFHTLLAKFRSRQASDPRDKVFALSGIPSKLTSQKPHDLLAARYDVSVLQVYSSTVRYCLEVDQSSDILCSAGLKVDDPSWPLWVPDWSLIAPSHTRLESATRYETLCDDEYVSRSLKVRNQTDRQYPYGSSVRVPSRRMAAAVKANDNTLSIRGILVGSLQCLWNPASGCPLSDALQTHFEGVALEIGPYSEAFGPHRLIWSRRRAWIRELAEDVLDDLACTAMPRTLGFLDNGMPIFGPSNMQTNDFVAMMLGCAVPLVFRNGRTYGGTSWPRQCRLVGECYVHGLMGHEQANEQGESEWLDEVAEWFEVT